MAKKTKRPSDSTALSIWLPNETIDELDAEAEQRGLSRSNVIRERVCQKKKMGEQDIAHSTERVAKGIQHLVALWKKYEDKANPNAIMQEAKSALTYLLEEYDAVYGKSQMRNYVFYSPEIERELIFATLKTDAQEKCNNQGKYTELTATTATGDLMVRSWTSTPLKYLKKGQFVFMLGYSRGETKFYADFILVVEDSKT